MNYRGKTIPILTAPIDWRQGFTAIPAHGTVVARALSGREDRRQRRARALFALRYQAATATARETGYVRGVMLAAKEMPVAVPFWPQAVRLTADAPAAAATLAHDSSADCYLFAGEQWALLYEHAMSWEVARIASITTDTQTALTAPLASAWGEGTTLFVPLLIGHLARPDTGHQHAAAGTWQIDFQEKFLTVEP